MVYLPGVDQAPVAIGSGRYRWSYAYAPPEAVTPALSLDSTWGDVIDHPMAYEQVVQLFLAHNPEFVARMEGQTAITLRQAIQQNPNAQALQERVEQALIDAGT